MNITNAAHTSTHAVSAPTISGTSTAENPSVSRRAAPGAVVLAGLGLLVLGVLVGYVGVLWASESNVAAAVFTFGYAVLYFVGAIGVIRHRTWGRVLGIAVGLISGAYLGQGLTAGALFYILSVILAVHVYVVVVLLFFWRQRAT